MHPNQVIQKATDLVTNIGGVKNDKNCFTHYLTIAILGGLLFMLSIILAVVLILLRKRQNVIKETVIKNQHGLRESLPLNALNVGAQLSLAAGSKRNQSELSVKQEGVYTALCSESVMTSDDDGSRTYASLVKSKDEDNDIEYENQISVLEYINA
ncbi:uncharacterized protein LOC111346574 [Stylophora pistillata]|uniref:uncharacterized protein LOC111346574 n=1 Tax=Stylophora pistillata TaxID=50429 RepID=UPI000C04CB2F|nr:uncharacterized protein LOC111346574 [Stylophora pistillata]